MQHVGNLRLRESGERTVGPTAYASTSTCTCARVGAGARAELRRRAGGAGAQGEQDAAAVQRVRADSAAPGAAAAQPVHPRRRRAARLAAQAAGVAAQPPGEWHPEDGGRPAAQAPAQEGLAVISPALTERGVARRRLV